jgi:hypothetical protein
MGALLDNLVKIFKPTTPDTPTPETPETTNVPWLRVGVILKSIPFEKLFPVFVSVPTIVFLTISGAIAWLALLVKFVVGMFNLW